MRNSIIALAACCLLAGPLAAQDQPLVAEVQAAMKRAATYYRQQVAAHGGYVYYYSPDLQRRLGEGVATADQIWVQPPGTPTVGLAFVRAYDATGDRFYLEAATAAAEALVYGQLKSGGWTNCVDFAPDGARRALYRNGRGRGKNHSTLDDGISQAALRLLMHVDRAHEFNHRQIHEAVRIGLDALLAAQFPNGAFPQVWTGPVEPQPVLQASYPDHDWRTEGRIKQYWNMYTLNDGVAGAVAQTLLDAHRVYQAPRYSAALRRLGDFLLLAQMPDPQPAWCQQYNYQMRPIWARKFEPPAVSGRESQDAMETLLRIARHSGDDKYLEPIPRALAYLRRSRLPDGRLARYYELRSNRPLYMSRRGDVYTLTYDDSRLPSHYGWKVASRLDAVEQQYQRLRSAGLEAPQSDARVTARQVRQILRELDDQGRWISTYQGQPLVGQPKFRPGVAFLSSAVFSENLTALSDFVASGEE